MHRLRAILRAVLGSADRQDGETHESRVSASISAVSDENWKARAHAVQTLGTLGAQRRLSMEQAEGVVQALVVALQDEHALVREAAAEAFGLLGEFMMPHAAALARALDTDCTWSVRAAAARSLGKLGDLASPHFSCLAAALRDESWQVRWSSLGAFHGIGARASMHVGECAMCVTDSCLHVRCAAAEALGSMRSASGIEALIGALDDRSWRVRLAASQALSLSGAFATNEAVAALARTMHDGCVLVALAAIKSMGRMGHLAAPYAAELTSFLRSPAPPIRVAARNAFRTTIGEFGIERLMSKQDSFLGDALETLVPWSIGVAPFVLECVRDLQNDDSDKRLVAEEALESLGAAAAPLVAEFVIQARGVDFDLRAAAMRALACTGVLSTDMACSFLAEWIYNPFSKSIPVYGVKVLKLQEPHEQTGQHLQWALLRGLKGKCYLAFRGSSTLLDWIENSFVSLRGVDVPDWGVLLMHSGFLSAIEGDSIRLYAALQEAAKEEPIDTLILCGGSKGGANALAAAVHFILPQSEKFQQLFNQLLVIVFGTPNIIGNGGYDNEFSLAHRNLRSTLQRLAPTSRSWLFKQDPVVAITSSRSDQVVSQYAENAGTAVRLFRWLNPDAFNRYTKYFEDIANVASTFQPILDEEQLVVPSGASSHGAKFDASVHPQLNYTEALCSRLLFPLRNKKGQLCRQFGKRRCVHGSRCEFAHGEEERRLILQYNSFVGEVAILCGKQKQTDGEYMNFDFYALA